MTIHKPEKHSIPSSEIKGAPLEGSRLRIALIDSGIGGLPYLEAIGQQSPGSSFLYFADHGNFPYGSKNDEQLRTILAKNLGYIAEHYRPHGVVIACNTASVATLDHLRSLFDFAIVGVVPAIKPAAAIEGPGAVGLLATEHTVTHPYVQSLVAQYSRHRPVISLAAPRLVSYVEDLLRGSEAPLSPVVQPLIEEFENSGVNRLVLGCTHFTHVARELAALVPSSWSIIDSRLAVARRTTDVLGGANETGHGRCWYYSSGGTGPGALAQSQFNLELLDRLEDAPW